MKGKQQRQSFRGRVTAAILLTSVAALLLGCTLFMVEQHHAESTAAARGSRDVARAFASAVADALSREDPAAARREVAALASMDRVVSVRVEDGHGRRVDSLGSTRAHAGEVQDYVAPLMSRNSHFGRLVVAMQPPPHNLVVSQFLGLGGALFFAAAGVAVFLGRWLAERVTRPVARLSQTMTTVGESGVFTVHVEPDASDEIGQLTTSFNQLMQRLHAKDQVLRGTMADLVEARDHAEAANVAKSQFLANMSHEIRTPLNGVLAMAQVMAMSGLPPEQQAQVDVIRQSGESLLGLLNDILDVSKIEAGKLELEVAEFDAEAVARTVHAHFAPVAAEKGLRLLLEIDDGARGLRRGDATRLRQILNNFLSNAIKFTASGEVALTLNGLGQDGADGIAAAVRDSGIGIPDDKRSLLFKKFSQVDASTTRRYGGTGLGLAICRELAELMEGEVWVDSQEGLGSTFNVRLPLARVGEIPPVIAAEPVAPAADPTQPTPVEQAVPGALRVLAAEDNATNQLVLSTVMQIFGCDLVLVGDGCAAVEAWREDRFDLILMDIQMPRMDGVAATRAIRAAEAADGRPYTPIIALSANALLHQVEEYRAVGMDDHVAKPIELDKLQAVMDRVLAGEAEPVAA